MSKALFLVATGITKENGLFQNSYGIVQPGFLDNANYHTNDLARKKSDSPEKRYDRFMAHRMNECMIKYGNSVQKLFYSLRDLLTE